MKKLFLGAAIAASSLTFAQTFGVKGGMNVSSLSKDGSLSDEKSKIGFYGGFFYNAPLATNFSIQPEILYSGLGNKYSQTYTPISGTTYTNSYSRNLSYITVPVMFQYNATPEFYLEAGPEFGFMVSASDKYKTTTNGSTTSNTTNDISTSNFNTFNFGLGIGAGYYFIPELGITVRYVAGLTDINKNDNGNSSVKNNVFQVGLAYKFK